MKSSPTSLETDLADLLERHDNIAKRYARAFECPTVPYEDLVQTGREAMIRAAAGFDPTRGTFGAYAKPVVRRAIVAELARSEHVLFSMPRRIWERTVEVRRIAPFMRSEAELSLVAGAGPAISMQTPVNDAGLELGDTFRIAQYAMTYTVTRDDLDEATAELAIFIDSLAHQHQRTLATSTEHEAPTVPLEIAENLFHEKVVSGDKHARRLQLSTRQIRRRRNIIRVEFQDWFGAPFPLW